MALMKWSKAYQSNIRVVDEDHQALFDMLKKLHNTLVTNKDAEHVNNVILRLQRYVTDHFQREEQFMANANYPLLEKHKEAHRRYQGDIEALSILFNQDPNNISVEKLYAYLQKWLVNHVQKMDMHFAAYIRTGGGQKPDAPEEPGQEIKTLALEMPADKAAMIENFIELVQAGRVPEDLQKLLGAYQQQKLKRARQLFLKSPG